MDSVASLSNADRSELFRQSAARRGLRQAIIEKDYRDMEDMLFAEVPTFKSIMDKLAELESEINTLKPS